VKSNKHRTDNWIDEAYFTALSSLLRDASTSPFLAVAAASHHFHEIPCKSPFINIFLEDKVIKQYFTKRVGKTRAHRENRT